MEFTAILFFLFLSSISGKYSVQLQRVNQLQPIISSQNEIGSTGSSIFTYNYNVAFVGGGQNALLVRCQNNTSDSNIYAVGPSCISYTKILTPLNELESIVVGAIDESNIVIEPNSPETSYGTEDPRIAFNSQDGNYYILYSAVANESGIPVSKLSLIITPDPSDKSTYQSVGPIFPQISWSKSGSLLIRPGVSYLYWGDSSLVPGIQMATTMDLIHYDYNSTIFLPTRDDFFDSALVEAGPLPLPLSDGNYLFLYNSARHGYPSHKPNWDEQYNVGWVVLDGNDPSVIIERSSEPILSPELAWENGTFPNLGLTPNVVFCEGWAPAPNKPDSFIIFYGAADSVVGVAEISVSFD